MAAPIERRHPAGQVPLAIVDTLAPHPYSDRNDSLIGLGGTEATVIAVVMALGIEVDVRQAARQDTDRRGPVRFAPLDLARPLPGDPARIVVINSWKVALKLRRLHPEAEIAVWLHVFPGRHNRGMGPALAQAGIGVVCVSAALADHLVRRAGAPTPRIDVVPNPIPDDLVPDATPRDPDLLLFASSPHKGLDQVFTAFAAARAELPDLRLAVADPGYLRWRTGPVPDGVEMLGRLEPPRLHALMRRALCLFYPQTMFAETFGLVVAEANALGCPALLHRRLGANDAVASDPSQLVDVRDPAQILERLRAWRDHPPDVAGRDEFRLSRVRLAWLDRLGLGARPAMAAAE
ncbi:glycosyltransferase [Wenxinia saemankumensis]|uniref:Glycosyltransferase involved in cell wall bisynthesis n=1 Tax=Wenxinia saemankumensis TaxID=1447782 RepID=A0A1M6HUH7_9RHOB|nr:glycosyltransferase [Wenxinia saemankumensis]SHJ25774.1 Glycosyltransferase involved in cell wall bisynthesis [Wenxinia saemankumensis]